MISIFGGVSVFVAVVSVYAMALHHKLMQRRSRVDEAIAVIHELKMLPDESELLQNDIDIEKEAIAAYNEVAGDYNAFISKYPGNLMAALVGLKVEEIL